MLVELTQTTNLKDNLQQITCREREGTPICESSY